MPASATPPPAAEPGPDPAWAIFRQDTLPGEGVEPFNPDVPAGAVDLAAVARDIHELAAALADIRAGREPATRPTWAWNVRLGNQQALFRKQLDDHRFLMFYIGDNVRLMVHDYGPAAYKMASARWGCSEAYMRDACLVADTWPDTEQREGKLAGVAWTVLKLLVYHVQPDKPQAVREKATDILHDAISTNLSKREVERRMVEEGLRAEPASLPPLPAGGQPPLTLLSGGLADADDPLLPASTVAALVRELRDVFDELRRQYDGVADEVVRHRMSAAHRTGLLARQGPEAEAERAALVAECNAVRARSAEARRLWNEALRRAWGVTPDDEAEDTLDGPLDRQAAAG